MKRELIVQFHREFEQLVQRDAVFGVEFWYARDLQNVLGYADWRNFLKVVEKAITSCKQAGYISADHFVDLNRMVDIGSSAKRKIEDIALTRYACYLIAQNGDPAKPVIAFAQTYFAVQTRKQELIEQRLGEVERLTARKKISASEKELSAIIYERVGDEQSFGRIRSKGDVALFGGLTTQGMKDRLRVPQGRPLADFLPTITIKAKDFANEITNFNIKRDELCTEPDIAVEHVRNNTDVRELLHRRGIVPEKLPPAEDTKKVERRLASDDKKLPKKVARLERGSDGEEG